MARKERNIKDICYLNELFSKAYHQHENLIARIPHIEDMENIKDKSELENILGLSEKIDRQLRRIRTVMVLICRQIVRLGLEPAYLRMEYQKLLQQHPISDYTNDYVIINGELRLILAPGCWHSVKQVAFIWFLFGTEHGFTDYELFIIDALYYREALLGTAIPKVSKRKFDADMLMERMVWGVI